jgi:hypothetical protein
MFSMRINDLAVSKAKKACRLVIAGKMRCAELKNANHVARTEKTRWARQQYRG